MSHIFLYIFLQMKEARYEDTRIYSYNNQNCRTLEGENTLPKGSKYGNRNSELALSY